MRYSILLERRKYGDTAIPDFVLSRANLDREVIAAGAPSTGEHHETLDPLQQVNLSIGPGLLQLLAFPSLARGHIAVLRASLGDSLSSRVMRCNSRWFSGVLRSLEYHASDLQTSKRILGLLDSLWSITLELVISSSLLSFTGYKRSRVQCIGKEIQMAEENADSSNDSANGLHARMGRACEFTLHHRAMSHHGLLEKSGTANVQCIHAIKFLRFSTLKLITYKKHPNKAINW